jgi:ATP-dependent DNA helicase RecG
LGKEVFPDIPLAMLHGRMAAEEKQKIMAAFASKQLQLLVATTVIEVGIDMPDATVMVVEHLLKPDSDWPLWSKVTMASA